MIDTTTAWEEAARDARAETIATQVVVPLRSDVTGEQPALTPDQRVTIALQSLERAAMQLDILGDDLACPELVARLDEIDTQLRRRRFALNMRMGLVHLTGVMGRQVP